MVKVYTRFSERSDSSSGIAQVVIKLSGKFIVPLPFYDYSKQLKAYCQAIDIISGHLGGVDIYKNTDYDAINVGVSTGKIKPEKYKEMIDKLRRVKKLKVDESHPAVDFELDKVLRKLIILNHQQSQDKSISQSIEKYKN